MIADTQCLVQCHAEAVLEVNDGVTSRDDGIDEFIAIDEDTIVAARLTCVRLHVVLNDPREISEIDRTRGRIDSQMSSSEMKKKLTAAISDVPQKCRCNQR